MTQSEPIKLPSRVLLHCGRGNLSFGLEVAGGRFAVPERSQPPPEERGGGQGWTETSQALVPVLEPWPSCA